MLHKFDLLTIGSHSYPVRVLPTGKVVGYPSALPRGTNSVVDLAAGPGGALLIAYKSGSSDLTQQEGHIARVTPSSSSPPTGPGSSRSTIG